MITLEQLMALAENSKEYKAIAQIVLSIVREFGEEADEVGDILAKGVAGLSSKLHKEYLNQGFTEEQAFTLLLSSRASVQKALSERNSNKSK